ncbi:MAG: hypothetical protein ACI9NN_001433, partial [Bacteroidia bacterium]
LGYSQIVSKVILLAILDRSLFQNLLFVSIQ